MQYFNFATFIVTLLNFMAGYVFFFSLENWYVGVSFVIGCLWVIFNGLVIEIAENNDPKIGRWS